VYFGYKHAGNNSDDNQGVLGMHSKDNIITFDGHGTTRFQYQPQFYALNSGSGSETGDGITSDPFKFPNAVINRGGGWNTSTNAFTAPVAGLYLFSCNPGYKQSGQNFIVRVSINGSNVTDALRLIGSTPNSHSGMSLCFLLNLAANDSVTISPSSTTYHRNNSSVPNWFGGYLLG